MLARAQEGGQLTEAVRRRPYQVILLDECEKAAREVSNVLLQVVSVHTERARRKENGDETRARDASPHKVSDGSIWLFVCLRVVVVLQFDEGHLTDGQGRKVDFRNTIIIMTSNLGAQATYEAEVSDPRLIEQMMVASVRQHFPPEFINRLDDMIVFNRLGLDAMPRIVDIQMAAVAKLLRDQKVEVRLTEQGRTWLATKGHDINYGARPLKRVIYKYVLNPLAIKILASQVREGSIVELRVDHRSDELVLHVVHAGKGEVVKPMGDTGLLEPEGAVIEPMPASRTTPNSMANQGKA